MAAALWLPAVRWSLLLRLTRVAVVASLLVAAGCNHSDRRDEPSSATPPIDAGARSGLRLVVVVTIDQLPTWTFERDKTLFTGGLKRLLESGIVAEGELPYANTYTAPGHATIGTGAPPSVTGILANSWYRRDRASQVSSVDDPEASIFGLEGRPVVTGVSSRPLRVDGVADVLRRSRPGLSKSVSVSLKDRGAVLMLGRRPDLALWYEDALPGMTTSSFYASKLPDWVMRFNDELPVNTFARAWSPGDATMLARVTGIADDSPGEGKGSDFGRTFPHDLSRSADSRGAIRLTPTGTELVLAAARAAVSGEALGHHAAPDLLGVSISSHDYAGHFWGQESWERLDLLLRLDLALGEFLDFLDREVGTGSYAVVLTSDHGANPMVELSAATGRRAYRVSTLRLVQVAGSAAARVLGRGKWVVACDASTLYMSDAFRALPADDQRRTLDAIAKALGRVPGVAEVRTTAELAGDCERRPEGDALICRSITDESGELFVVPTRGSSLSGGYQTGTSHGSPSREDRFVPVLVTAPGLAPATLEKPVSMLQVAPTVSALLGIDSPPAATMLSIIPPTRGPSAAPGAPARPGPARTERR